MIINIGKAETNFLFDRSFISGKCIQLEWGDPIKRLRGENFKYTTLQRSFALN